MLKFKSTIFSDENDLYVALQSNKSRITDKALKRIALERGILFNSELNRNELIGRLSELPFSFNHLKKLSDKLVPRVSREQYSLKRASSNFDLDKLQEVLDKVKENRPRFSGTETISPEKSFYQFIVDVDYTEFDFTKGKYQQKKRFGGSIIFTKTSKFVSIQFTYTERINGLLKDIIKTYKSLFPDIQFKITEVNLSEKNASFRNQFINSLFINTKKITFLKEHKVSLTKVLGLDSAFLSKEEEIKNTLKDDLLDKDILDEDILDEDILDEDILESQGVSINQNKQEQPLDKKTHDLKNVSYDGDNLSVVDDIKEKCKLGFYKSRVLWESKITANQRIYKMTCDIAFEDKFKGKDLKFRIVKLRRNEDDIPTKDDYTLVVKTLEEHIFKCYDDLLTESEKVIKEMKEAS